MVSQPCIALCSRVYVHPARRIPSWNSTRCRTLEASDSVHGDGTITGTEVTTLTQRPIRKLLLATRERAIILKSHTQRKHEKLPPHWTGDQPSRGPHWPKEIHPNAFFLNTVKLNQMSTHAMARKKDELVSELKTLPPCTRDDCKEHKIPTSLIVEDSNINESTSDEINYKVKKKKPSKKRKNKNKESLEEFIFPKKAARPVSPTSTQDPIETKNNFSDLEQDVEHPLPTDKIVNSEKITPPTKLPHHVMLKIKKNFREQMKLITEKFPKIRNRTIGDVVKMFTNDHDEYRSLIQYLKTDIEFEFYVIDNKKKKNQLKQ
ncbi:uncharacterized protein TNCV_928491 [Trichonephila clavipes]|nr:uncharacterized protein TNCV_928491 [Trichonephila clavipes]